MIVVYGLGQALALATYFVDVALVVANLFNVTHCIDDRSCGYTDGEGVLRKGDDVE